MDSGVHRWWDVKLGDVIACPAKVAHPIILLHWAGGGEIRWRSPRCLASQPNR